MADVSPDLPAYLARIGHAGPARADLPTLEALALLHPAAIAFENLDAMVGRAPSLALPDLEAKLVRGGRGGWCFEQNLLLAAMLQALGFAVRHVAARVMVGRPPDAPPGPRSHMALIVETPDGPRLIDVGFGGRTPTAPLALTDAVQATPHEPMRLVPLGEAWRLEVLVGAEWQPLYRFDLAETLPVDHEAPNWYLATHPASHFRVRPVAARPLPDGRRLSLAGRRFTVRTGAREEAYVLADNERVGMCLHEEFGLILPADAATWDALGRE
ncbi:arylamine N-acetyltransferase family protein [Wenxinia marina]|uniref:Arylamine N-acetyltransferase n=1 Tax=Wenxinia marina DSM 24838 TaxID=1123501 RepID=A0A0D0QJY7_9RHOB|nr:arylamine N-acetyltransferase [Wenxinia marina]KIQ71323.1 Arylamine N-acetyltransferase [Wenxinia marina DSM 24838]GGL73896.1 N-hydroxyarylamine O-acetyltransferase [Wenxinia marina]